MTKSRLIIGNEKAEPEALERMRERGGEWYAYQNHDMGHPQLGHLKFLKCGHGCTFATAPTRMPDTPDGAINWRYILAGKVNLASGEIEQAEGV